MQCKTTALLVPLASALAALIVRFTFSYKITLNVYFSFFAELTLKVWQVYRLSPLYNLQTGKSDLQRYSHTLSSHVAAVSSHRHARKCMCI